MCLLLAHAEPQYPFQSENPIANFACNENDTSRYEGHYRFENAYRLIEDMLEDKRPLDFAEAVFAVENCMYDGKILLYQRGQPHTHNVRGGVEQNSVLRVAITIAILETKQNMRGR